MIYVIFSTIIRQNDACRDPNVCHNNLQGSCAAYTTGSAEYVLQWHVQAGYNALADHDFTL